MPQNTLNEHTLNYVEHEASKSFRHRVQELLPDGGNLTLCLSCGACTSSCPASGLEGMDPRKFLRLASLGMDEEVTSTPWVWQCTLCMRCVYNCPMQINIPQLVYYARQSWKNEDKPKGIANSCSIALNNQTNSALGISEESFIENVQEVLEEVHKNQQGQEDLKAPINKENCHYILNQNSRGAEFFPYEMSILWKILKLAKADWTYSSKAFAAENYCLFAAHDEGWKEIVQNKTDAIHELKAQTCLTGECGHELYALRVGMKRFNIENNFKIESIVQKYADWIREGKLKPSSDWNKDLQIKFTVHDPCQLVRKGFGNPIANDLRYALATCVGEENIIEMHPNRSSNYCCGGGGGALQNGFKEARLKYGKVKHEQILTTKADYVLTACHNCYTQINDLAKHYKAPYKAIHLLEILALSLNLLDKSEQSCLDEKLAKIIFKNTLNY